MKLTSLLSTALASLALTLPLVAAETLLHFPGKEGAGKGKRVVLLAGDEEYRSEEAMPMLAKILSQHHGFDCTVLFSADAEGMILPGGGELLTNPAALDTADALVMSLRFRHWDDDAMRRFEAALLRGVPIVALRTSTHAFNFKADSPWANYSYNSKGTWKGGFGREVLGETWVAHHGKHKVEGARGIIEPAAREHPVLRAVADVFAESDVYTAAPPADATILMRGEVTATLDPASPAVEGPKNAPRQPLVWTREYRNAAGKVNRVVCTTMGAACDLDNEGLRRLVVNGVFWGLGLDVPARASVEYVDPYSPSFYGFKTERQGLKVRDLGLGMALPPPPPIEKKPAPAAEKKK
jgi:hypothetical protein